MDLGAFWAIYFPGSLVTSSHDALLSQERHSSVSRVRLSHVYMPVLMTGPVGHRRGRASAPHITFPLQTLAVPPVPIQPLRILDERMPQVTHHLRDLISCPKCPPASSPLLM